MILRKCLKEEARVFQDASNLLKRKFQKCSKQVSTLFQQCFKCVSRMLQRHFHEVFMVSEERSEGLMRKFQGVYMVFHGSFMGFLSVWKNIQGVSRMFQ